MRDPRQILTGIGLIDYITWCGNLNASAFNLRNNADDLLLDDDDLDLLGKMEDLSAKLLNFEQKFED